MEHLYTADDKKRGKLIRYYRIKRGLTQADLARKLGVSVNTVWDWEQGRKPSVKHLHQLCQVLQIPQEWLELDLADPCNAKKIQFALLRRLNLSPETQQILEEAINQYYGEEVPLPKIQAGMYKKQPANLTV